MPPTKFTNALDALPYLTLVKLELATDRYTFGLFLAELAKWLELQKTVTDGANAQDWVACILRIASLLRFKPGLLQGLNTLLAPDNHRLECSTTVDEVRYFVLVGPTSARILSTSGSEVPFPSTDHDIHKLVISKQDWNAFLNANHDRDWLTCISQLLQVIMDRPAIDSIYARKVYRCLHELAARSILPPSIFINNVKRGDGHAVQGGAFADIYKGEMKGTPVCLRVLRMFDTPEENRESLYKDFCSEVLVWRQLRHPNILPFLGANLDIFSPRFCFVSPWMHNGDVMSFLKQHPDHDRFRSIYEIVQGIEYLHGLDPPVTHKDIKGTNVLVRDDLVCCLGDFGLSSIVESQDLDHGSPPIQGSVCWMAPELLDPSRSVTHDPKAGDIYALACTIYEIYTGRAPFLDTKKALPAIMLAVLRGERPALPPPGTWTNEEHLWWLVSLCWKEKPEDRPEIHLIKNELRDIGTFKAKAAHMTLSTSLEPKDSVVHVGEIVTWLEKENQQMLPLLTNGHIEAQKSIPPQVIPNLPKTELQLDDKPKRQVAGQKAGQQYDESVGPSNRKKFLTLSSTYGCRPTVIHSKGLLTPMTPSSELTDFNPPSSHEISSDALPDILFPLNGKANHSSGIDLPIGEASKASVDNLLGPKQRSSFPTPPSTPLPPSIDEAHPAAVKVMQHSVNVKVKALQFDISALEPPPSISRKRLFLPGQQRQSNIKYGARPQVRRPVNVNGLSSFNHTASPLSQCVLTSRGLDIASANAPSRSAQDELFGIPLSSAHDASKGPPSS